MKFCLLRICDDNCNNNTHDANSRDTIKKILTQSEININIGLEFNRIPHFYGADRCHSTDSFV
jgi:hypothetical protein